MTLEHQKHHKNSCFKWCGYLESFENEKSWWLKPLQFIYVSKIYF